jgi:hypothetical protein
MAMLREKWLGLFIIFLALCATSLAIYSFIDPTICSRGCLSNVLKELFVLVYAQFGPWGTRLLLVAQASFLFYLVYRHQFITPDEEAQFETHDADRVRQPTKSDGQKLALPTSALVAPSCIMIFGAITLGNVSVGPIVQGHTHGVYLGYLAGLLGVGWGLFNLVNVLRQRYWVFDWGVSVDRFGASKSLPWSSIARIEYNEPGKAFLVEGDTSRRMTISVRCSWIGGFARSVLDNVPRRRMSEAAYSMFCVQERIR